MKTLTLIVGFAIVLVVTGCNRTASIRAAGDGDFVSTGESTTSSKDAAQAAKNSARNHCEKFGLHWESLRETEETGTKDGYRYMVTFHCTQPIVADKEVPIVLWDRLYSHHEYADSRRGAVNRTVDRQGREINGRINAWDEYAGWRDREGRPMNQPCASDYDCSKLGMWCKKKPYNNKGVCGVVVSETGYPLALEPRLDSQGITNKFQCRTDRDCIQGFVCEKEYKVCEKGW